MFDPTKSDDVAAAMAGDADKLARLALHGAVPLCGYVKMTARTIPATDDTPATTVHDAQVYTNASLDNWIDVPSENVYTRIAGADEDHGRSLIWVEADARITHSRTVTAADLSETMLASGLDDPTAYPATRPPRGGGG